jgi:hypothetical protein
LTAIGIMPSAPVLVPELAGAAAVELADLHAAVRETAALLPPRWIAVGTGPADCVLDSDAVGTFAGFGVDVPVRLSPPRGAPPAVSDVPEASALPLCALMAGWVRGQTRPEASVQVRVWRSDSDVGAALAHGRRLRAEIDLLPDPIGVLIVADGANTLTPAAPGGYRPDDADAQLALDDALATGDVAALTRLPDPILGRVAFQVLVGLTEPGPRSVKELYRAAPYGVGYFVGVWQP